MKSVSNKMHSLSRADSASNSPNVFDSSNKSTDWTEHKAPDERTYYYNRVTKKSSWEKPDELKTPAELMLSRCPWKEHRSDTGKVYYHNSVSKESRWTKPKELEELEAFMSGRTLGDATRSPAQTTPTYQASPSAVAKAPSAIEAAMQATLASIELPPPPSQKVDATEAVSSSEAEDDNDTVSPGTDGTVLYKNKREAIEAFKNLLKDNDVTANATWESAIKLIANDSRFAALKHLNEKKQAFNAYKTQRLKEDKETERLRQKQAKEDLEEFLLNNDDVSSTLKYRKAESMFGESDLWLAVADRDRREIFEDAMHVLAKREKEEAKTLRKRNIKVFNDILDSMLNLTFKTTWSEAQHLLLDDPRFAEDPELLNMDKEDALICFEEHIRMLEQENDDDKERERRRVKRQQRKDREGFLVLLDELHDNGKLNSMSLWMDLYHIISQDVRFHNMLGQPGSTPLDLFKFYVEDLKARFHDEKKIVKEIIKERNYFVELGTTYEEFANVLAEDKRAGDLDSGNVKLTYNSLLEKAEAREKERQKDEARKQRKLELSYKNLLRNASPPVDVGCRWEEIRERFHGQNDFEAITLESEKIRLFKEYMQAVEESCSHHHSKKRKKKKGTKKRSSSRSEDSDTDQYHHHHHHHHHKATGATTTATSATRAASPATSGRQGATTSPAITSGSKQAAPVQSTGPASINKGATVVTKTPASKHRRDSQSPSSKSDSYSDSLDLNDRRKKKKTKKNKKKRTSRSTSPSSAAERLTPPPVSKKRTDTSRDKVRAESTATSRDKVRPDGTTTSRDKHRGEGGGGGGGGGGGPGEVSDGELEKERRRLLKELAAHD